MWLWTWILGCPTKMCRNRLTGERSGGSLKAEPGQSPRVDKGEQLPLQTETPKAAPAAGEKRWFSCFSCGSCCWDGKKYSNSHLQVSPMFLFIMCELFCRFLLKGTRRDFSAFLTEWISSVEKASGNRQFLMWITFIEWVSFFRFIKIGRKFTWKLSEGGLHLLQFVPSYI